MIFPLFLCINAASILYPLFFAPSISGIMKSDEPSFFSVPRIPHIPERKCVRTSVSRDRNPHTVCPFLVSVAEEPVPYKVFVIRLFVPEHQIRHGISVVDMSSDKSCRLLTGFLSRQFFHSDVALPCIPQISAESVSKHIQPVHSIYPGLQVRLHLHREVHIVSSAERLYIMRIEMNHPHAQSKINAAVACRCRRASANIHNDIPEPLLAAADSSVYRKIFQYLLQFQITRLSFFCAAALPLYHICIVGVQEAIWSKCTLFFLLFSHS